MARKALLAHVPIPSANCHPIPVDGTPEDAAISYEKTLRSFAEHRSARTLFDVLLLGLGEDGHTASLFPSSEVLTERHAWVAAVTGMQSEARITLTYSALNRSEDAAFLVVGEKKRAILRRFLCGDPALPSVRVQPRGSVTVFADRAAAGE